MRSEKEKLKRQRSRNVSFDLNRSSPQVREKYFKDNLERRMSTPMESSIIDMSETIKAKNTGAIPKTPGNSKEVLEDNSEELSQSVKELVMESVQDMKRSLDHSIRDVVSETVNRQLSKVNESIAILSEAVRSLAINNNKQNTNLPRPSMQAGRAHNPEARIYEFPSSQRANVQPEAPRISSMGQGELQMNNSSWNKPRVERFGLKFNGYDNHLSVESFIFRLEYFQRQYQIPWREIMDDFHLLVTGPASDWYWLYVETTPITSWDGLRHSLLNRFKTHRTNLEIMHELVERKQRPGESVDSYFFHLNILRAKLEQPISEFELIKLAKKNLRESIGRMVYPIAVSSMEQLRIECVEAERHFARKEIREQPVKKFVHEIEQDGDNGGTWEVEEINAALTCWNCKQPGHTFVLCPSTQRELFCYKCGKPDTITPNCPDCRTRGNSKRGVISTGESRPRKTTPKH